MLTAVLIVLVVYLLACYGYGAFLLARAWRRRDLSVVAGDTGYIDASPHRVDFRREPSRRAKAA